MFEPFSKSPDDEWQFADPERVDELYRQAEESGDPVAYIENHRERFDAAIGEEALLQMTISEQFPALTEALARTEVIELLEHAEASAHGPWFLGDRWEEFRAAMGEDALVELANGLEALVPEVPAPVRKAFADGLSFQEVRVLEERQRPPNGPPKSHREIGRMVGAPPARIRRLERSGLAKLRNRGSHRRAPGAKPVHHRGARRTTGSGSTSSGESGDSDPDPPAPASGAERQQLGGETSESIAAIGRLPERRAARR